MQLDKEARSKEEFESLRGQRIRGATGVLLGIVITGLFLLLLFDPFGWLAGSPQVHDAKKWVALSFGAIVVPCIAGIWFLLVGPVRWGVIIGGLPGRSSSRDYLIFRSQDPRRFWLTWRINLYVLICPLASAFGAASLRCGTFKR